MGFSFNIMGPALGSVIARPNPRLLLDLFPGAAAAYSLRRLSFDYNGPAIRIRRSSDNLEQDIGFKSNNFDTVQAEDFCGASDGFVVKWYDQSGSNDAVQNTAGAQPKIVQNGSVIKDNSLPALDFDGSSTSLINNLTISTLNISIFTLNKSTANNNNRRALDIGDNSGGINSLYNSVDEAFLNKKQFGYRHPEAETVKGPTSDKNTNLITYRRTSISLQVARWNGNQFSNTQNTTTFTSEKMTIGGDNGGNIVNFWEGFIQELIIYPLDKSADVIDIENNIATYFNITV